MKPIPCSPQHSLAKDEVGKERKEEEEDEKEQREEEEEEISLLQC